MPNPAKLAQMAAYFLHLAGGGPMDHVKLMKLMYLADREALDTYGFPISDDTYSSMKWGPVLDTALDLFYGRCDEELQKEWNKWASTKQGHVLSPRKKIAVGELDLLADVEIAATNRVFEKFGDRNWRDIADYTHDLEEWADPGEGAPKDAKLPISLKSILVALKKPADEVERRVRYLTEIEPGFRARTLSEALSSFVDRDPKTHADALAAILGA